jgi:hypothetical protein
MVIGLSGIVYADQPVPAVPETQTLATTTTADVVGLTMETDAGAWTLTNSGGILDIFSPGAGFLAFPLHLYPGSPLEQQLIAGGGSVDFASGGPSNYFIVQIKIPESMLDTPIAGVTGLTWQYIKNSLLSTGYSLKTTSGGIHTGTLDPGQVQYTTAYDANIVAQAGHTVFTKSMNIDTRNKVISQPNLNTKTTLTFAATADGGNAVGSENLMIDGAGNHTKASDRMLCPFSSYPVDIIPAYCNIVQAGSKYDLTIGSVTTTANDHFISSDATSPVVLNYDISVKPYGTSQGQIPAMGSAMAYIKAHIQEARNDNAVNFSPFGGYYGFIPGTPLKSEDLVYKQQSSAQGTITSFTKVIAYQSGKSLL